VEPAPSPTAVRRQQRQRRKEQQEKEEQPASTGVRCRHSGTQSLVNNSATGGLYSHALGMLPLAAATVHVAAHALHSHPGGWGVLGSCGILNVVFSQQVLLLCCRVIPGTVGDAPGAAAAAAAAGNADEVEAQQPEVIGEVQPQRPAAAAAAGGSGGAGSSRIAGEIRPGLSHMCLG
jgi:hypothetical protein